MSEAAEPIPRSNLGERVYRLLWERILDHRLRPGEKVSDLHLSQELGVSRTPVREALHRLVSDGIVRVEPNRGFYVASFSADDIAEVYDLRATLETMALAAAAPTLSEELLRSALASLDTVEARLGAARTDAEKLEAAAAFLEVDRGFHRLLVDLADNSRLGAMVEGLWAQIAVFQWAGSFREQWTDAAITRHRAVIAALLAGDVGRATAELQAHIAEVKAWVIDDLGAEPEGALAGRSRRADTPLADAR